MDTFAILVPAKSYNCSSFLDRAGAYIPPFLGGKMEGVIMPSKKIFLGWVICLPPGFIERKQNLNQVFEMANRLKVKVLGLGEISYKENEFTFYNQPFCLSLGYIYRAILIRTLLCQLAISHEIPLGNLKVAVVGLENEFGRLCARVLATICRKLILCGISEHTYRILASQILYETGVSALMFRGIRADLRDIDIVVLMDSDRGEEKDWVKQKALIVVANEATNNQMLNNNLGALSNSCFNVNDFMVKVSGKLYFRSHWLFKALTRFFGFWPEWLNCLAAKEKKSLDDWLIPDSLAETILLTVDSSLSFLDWNQQINLKFVQKIEQLTNKLNFNYSFCSESFPFRPKKGG